MRHSPLRLSLFVLTLIAAWTLADGPTLPEASAQSNARSAPAPERRTTRTTTTTTSDRRVRNVRPNPNAPRGRNEARGRDDRYRGDRGRHPHYRPPAHARPPQRHYRTRHHVYTGPRRSRIHRRYHHYPRPVVEHHHTEVVIVEVDRFSNTELSCPARTHRVATRDEQYCATTRGTRHGPYMRMHPNGQIAEEGEYLNGTRVGLWTQWHTNGEPASEGEYYEGSRVGAWIRWTRNGLEASVVNY